VGGSYIQLRRLDNPLPHDLTGDCRRELKLAPSRRAEVAWGVISSHNPPVEADPDIADTATVITQLPSRPAEEVEQQVTVPVEIVMNGLPHLTHLRSESIFGLSYVLMIFDDQSDNDWKRQKVLERLTQVTLPQALQPQIGMDWSTVGQIYWYTLSSTNPKYDLTELRSIEDWTLEKEFKSVPNVVDVSDFGGGVTKPETASQCLDAEAQFLTSDGFHPAMIEFGAKESVVVIPGGTDAYGGHQRMGNEFGFRQGRSLRPDWRSSVYCIHACDLPSHSADCLRGRRSTECV
jgi:hypothetical protein